MSTGVFPDRKSNPIVLRVLLHVCRRLFLLCPPYLHQNAFIYTNEHFLAIPQLFAHILSCSTSSVMHREFPVVAFLAALSLLLPLPWHWRAGNVATLSIIAWLIVVNIIYGVDAIVWGNNVDIVIPVWCDISELRLICSLLLSN